MANQITKIIYSNGVKNFNMYMDLTKHYRGDYTILYQRIQCELYHYNIKPTKFSMFWIDNDGDRIDILDTPHLKIFWDMSNENPRLFVSAIPNTTDPTSSLAGSVHKGVSCDNCKKTELEGFRYKCLQCPNYDLCENCEREHVHQEHIMLRVPDDTLRAEMRAVIEEYRYFRNLSEGRSAKTDCPLASFPAGCSTAPAELSSKRVEKGAELDNCTKQGNAFANFLVMLTALGEGGRSVGSPKPNTVQTVVAESVAATASAVTTAVAAGVSAIKEVSKTSSVSTDLLPQTLEKESAARTKEKENINNETAANTNLTSASNVGQFVENIDQNYLKAGVEILGNFSNLFNKMLDTLESTDGNVVVNNEETGRQPSISSTTDTAAVENTKTGRQPSISSTTDTVAVENAKKSEEQEQPKSESASVELNTNIGQPRSPSLEGDWQLVDNQQTVPKQEQGQAQETPISSTPDLIEIKPEDAPSAPNEERRFMPFYHTDRRINQSVHAMIAMGFSNENDWLTQLLVSVDGNISAALELMHEAHANNI